MKNYKLFAAAAVSLLLAACTATTDDGMELSAEANLMTADISPRQGKMALYSAAAATPNSNDIAQKLTRTAEITFQTNDVEATKTYIEACVSQFAGLIDDENTTSESDRKSCHITARVPAERLDTFMAVVESGAMRIESKSVSQEDVTTNYIDLTTRLENKRKLEKRYKTLLAKATGVNDMLSIEREMNQLRSEIESTERQLRYLDRQVAYSRCDIDFFELQNVNVRESGSQIANAFKTGGQWFVVFLLWLVQLWPFIVLAAAIAVPIVWRAEKRKNNR